MSSRLIWEKRIMPELLEIRNLNVFYGDLQALWNVSIVVRQGELVVLVGSNGAGKTTLLRSIVGLHRPASGDILLDGQPIHVIPAHQIVERGIVLVPEGRRLFVGMSVLENLEIGAFTARARHEKAKSLEWVFEIFPILAQRQHQLAGMMSGGQQQMVAVARALMGLPRLLILDEPSLGLAPLVVENIFEVVQKVNRSGVAVLLVEQNVHAALELAHRAYIVEQGRVVGQGTGADLLTDENVRQAYLGYLPEPSQP
jgi:branched-chain amino acid transport system ATP-binding protein